MYRYKCGYTLRFPRLECVRLDKSWNDCMTTVDLEKIYQLGQGRLTTTHFTEGDSETGKRKKNASNAIASSFKTRAVLATFRGADLRGVKKDSDLFLGLTFYVINGSTTRDKNELEKLIAKHGGDLIQNPPSTYSETCIAVVYNENVARVHNIEKTQVCDILRPEWLDECIKEGRIVPKRPTYVVFATYATKQEISKYFDNFGDSYFEDTTVANLQTVFSFMEEEEKKKKSKAKGRLLRR